MNHFTFCVPCLFGLEGLVGDELRRMDAQNVQVENGRVYFSVGFLCSKARSSSCPYNRRPCSVRR